MLHMLCQALCAPSHAHVTAWGMLLDVLVSSELLLGT